MSSKINQISEDLTELKTLMSAATRPRVKDLLMIEIRRLEFLSLKSDSTDAPAPKPVSQGVAGSGPTRFTTEIINYGWDQSDKFVKLFVSLNGVQSIPENQIKVSYTEHSVEVVVEDLDKKDHKLTIKNTLDALVPEKSYHKVKTDMVVVYMQKAKAGKKWDYLTKTAKKVDNKKEEVDSMMSEDPNAALMNIMKKMYETGDASTKQMIEKAYTENMNKSTELPPM